MTGMLGVEGIRSRMTELATMIDPSAAASTATSSSSTRFASLLAAADDTAALSSLTDSGQGSGATSTLSGLASLLSSAGSSGTAAAGTDISSGAATAQDLIADAEKYLGVPYKWGGESLSEGGLDCSGLVLRSLTDLGVSGIPRTAKEQMSLGAPVADLSQAKPGDLLVFHGGTHIAIYLGDNRMIEAPKAGSVVRETAVWATPTAIRRILPQADLTGAAGASYAPGATTTASAQRALLSLLSGVSA